MRARCGVTRLGSMPGIRALTSAMAAVACATALAACGGEDENGPIPPEQGNQLLERLSEIEAAVDQGDCDRARQLAVGLAEDVGRLPLVEDPELRDALVEASGNLVSLTEDPQECQPDTGATGPAETVPTTETTTPTTTEPTTTEEPEEEDEGRGPPDEPPGGGKGDPGGGNDNGNGGGGSDDDDSSGGIGSDG